MMSANEPAATILPPPAPEIASAPKLCPSDFAVGLTVFAETVKPFELTVPATTAVFVTSARVTATPTPIVNPPAPPLELLPLPPLPLPPLPLPPVLTGTAARPSAFEDDWDSAADETITAPVEL